MNNDDNTSRQSSLFPPLSFQTCPFLASTLDMMTSTWLYAVIVDK